METVRKSDSQIVRIVRFVGTALRQFYLMRCIFRVDRSCIRVVLRSEYWTCLVRYTEFWLARCLLSSANHQYSTYIQGSKSSQVKRSKYFNLQAHVDLVLLRTICMMWCPSLELSSILRFSKALLIVVWICIFYTIWLYICRWEMKHFIGMA